MGDKEIKIALATKEHLIRCSEILGDSELGKQYFVNSKGEYIGDKLLESGFDNNEIYISTLNDDSKIVGFSWIQERGIFHWFPFLHVVAVDKNYQHKGIGKAHMEHFENMCRNEFNVDKGFLIVGEYNKGAYSLYEKLGYKTIGNVPSLFIEGIDEILMYKDINEDVKCNERNR